MSIYIKKRCKKKLSKLTQKQKDRFTERLVLFRKEPYNRILRNHSLSGKYEGFRSINISGDFRAIYYKTSKGDYIFVDIGNYSELYR